MISQFAKCRGDVEGKRAEGRMDRSHALSAAAASKRDDGAQVLRTCRYYSAFKSGNHGLDWRALFTSNPLTA